MSVQLSRADHGAPWSTRADLAARTPGTGSPVASLPPAIAAERLEKAYELRPVLRGITFVLSAGGSLALLGPNGAGKTTLLRILATLAKPSGGVARVSGLDVAREASTVRRQVGYVGHQPLLYDELTAEENLLFFARMYALRDGKRRVAQLLAWVGLRAKSGARVATLSRGQAQRLALARGILHDPAVLLLDEPDTGLDEPSLALLDELVTARRASGQATLLTTHALERGLRLAESVLALVGGRVAHAGPSAQTDAAALRALLVREPARREGGA